LFIIVVGFFQVRGKIQRSSYIFVHFLSEERGATHRKKEAQEAESERNAKRRFNLNRLLPMRIPELLMLELIYLASPS
jgi:hypothetical protein